MFSRLHNFWVLLRESLWFVPLLISLAYFAGTIVLYLVEQSFPEFHTVSAVFYNGTVNDAKDVITTLLSAMITMATLAISITMLVLSLAAAQLGPRIIRIFMSSRKTQIYIGIFTGTVVACMTLTRILHDQELAEPLPSLTISLVFAACFINLYVLLGFLHHVAQSSIADNVVTQVGKNLIEAIRRLTEISCDIENRDLDKTDFPVMDEDQKAPIVFERSGYIQNINYGTLMEVAEEHKLVIEVKCKAGYYLVSGEKSIFVWPRTCLDDDISASIKSAFIIGNSRTSTQDIEYSIRHLVEIALRALSPGINDPYTAIAVLNHLSASLSELFKRNVPPNIYRDEKGFIRVIGEQSYDTDIILSAFSQIRVAGDSKPDIIRHLLHKLGILYQVSNEPGERNGLRRVHDAVNEDINRNFSGTDIGQELLRLSESIVPGE